MRYSSILSSVAVALLLCGSSRADSGPAIGHADGFVGGSHQGVVVETSSGLGIYKYDDELLLVTSDGWLFALEGLDAEILYAYYDPDGNELSVYKFKGAECKPDGPCPGGAIREPNANIKGCKRKGNECEGQCTHCAGSTHRGRFCVDVSDLNVTCLQTINQSFRVNCGTQRKYDCHLSSGGPGTPPRPNGCQCDTSSSPTTVSQDCEINTCTS